VESGSAQRQVAEVVSKGGIPSPVTTLSPSTAARLSFSAPHHSLSTAANRAALPLEAAAAAQAVPARRTGPAH